MTTAQLQLPFDRPEQTQPKPNDKSQRKSSSTKGFVRVEELTRPEQDVEVLHMARKFVQDVHLHEHVDDDVLLLSCIKIRRDIDRKYINLFIAYQDDTPVGFLVGVTMPALHRLGVVAEQKLWYVDPKARGTLAAKLLMTAYEQWARINGADQLFTGTANLRYAERTSKLLEHLGYARVGALHVKEI